MGIGQIDPERVAVLPDDIYEAFAQGMQLAHDCSREDSIPESLYVLTYRTANRCGARVRSFGDMRCIAVQFLHRRLTIERLRRN
jgi:hypothetical protein